MSAQRETPVQLRRAIGAVRRARQHEADAAWWVERRTALHPMIRVLDVTNANYEWARAAMHLLQWGLS